MQPKGEEQKGIGALESEAEVWLKGDPAKGCFLSACFIPSKGMNLASLKKGDYEAIDQSTRPLFEERSAGLGPLIGPHFHHRLESVIPPIENPALFPHIAKVFAKGIKEPFSHGIGRYAPWRTEVVSETSIKAVLSGDDTWKGVKLKDLEGQNFLMHYEASIVPEGLEIRLSVKSDTESVIGLHTYYSLGGSPATVKTRIQDHYVEKSEFKPIPSTWNLAPDHTLHYPVAEATDFGFHPFPDPLNGDILLECKEHQVRVQYWCENEENSFQLWHPEGASFVCIEPLSAKDPRKPKLTVSRLKILISII